MAPFRPTLLVLFFVFVSSALGAPPAPEKEPSKRSFSLFAVVNFPNDQCTAKSDSNLKGICFSSTECNDKGGNSDGACASGFGACCTFIITECGGTVTQNCTYIRNPGYPSSYAITASTTCTYRVTPVETNICQLRLDMDNMVIANPTTGACSTDTFVATSPTGRSPPTICGTNTGQHMYVEVGMSTSQSTLVFTMNGATASTRTYSVKVNQIPCGVNYKAPNNCVKYYTGTSGVVNSYNWGGTTSNMLADQDYGTCVRQEMGNCAIQWSQSAVSSPMPFALHALDGIAISAIANSVCAISYITIPLPYTAAIHNKFCGGSLNTGANAIAAQSEIKAGAVTSTQVPFVMHTFGDNNAQAATLTGYSIMYSQVPC